VVVRSGELGSDLIGFRDFEAGIQGEGVQRQGMLVAGVADRRARHRFDSASATGRR
jgi:hypothetical protein